MQTFMDYSYLIAIKCKAYLIQFSVLLTVLCLALTKQEKLFTIQFCLTLIVVTSKVRLD